MWDNLYYPCAETAEEAGGSFMCEDMVEGVFERGVDLGVLVGLLEVRGDILVLNPGLRTGCGGGREGR